MRKALLWLGVILGVVEILGTASWVVIAIGWGALTSEIANASVFLVTGPLLVLPASILAFREPRI